MANSSSLQSSTFVNFYGRVFLATRDVLSPRPETEQLIDAVLDLCGVSYLPGVKPGRPLLDPKNLKILDVGTGSGCIAITLKKEFPEAEIFASDISKKALNVAEKNAKRLGTPITFIISHLLQNVKFTSVTATASVINQNPSQDFSKEPPLNIKSSPLCLVPTPDLIVANLPYVDSSWEWLDKESLKSDPALALYAEDGGLKLIKELIDTSPAPFLILECDPSQHEEVIKYAKTRYKLLKKMGYILIFKNI